MKRLSWRLAARIAVLCVALVAGAARAEHHVAFARARVDPSGPVIAGQAVRVTVEVFVPTWFSGAPVFPELDIADAVVIFTDRGTNLSERVDGNTLAGQSRDYLVYPQAAGLYEIDAIPVVYRAAFQPDPLAAVMDLWLLAYQMEACLAAGTGPCDLGDQQPLVREAGRAQREELERQLKKAAIHPEAFRRFQKRIQETAARYPGFVDDGGRAGEVAAPIERLGFQQAHLLDEDVRDGIARGTEGLVHVVRPPRVGV